MVRWWLLFLLFACCSTFSLASWLSPLNPLGVSRSTLLHLLDTGGYAMLSADAARLANLSSDLTDLYLYSNILGMYDGTQENSFLVVLQNERPADELSLLYQLGEKYQQESIIYVQQLIYTTGPFSGTYVEGQGYRILCGNTTENYSRVQLCPTDVLTFTLNFDFEQMIVAADQRRIRTQMLVEHHARKRQR
jgi:hypothetical protein